LRSMRAKETEEESQEKEEIKQSGTVLNSYGNRPFERGQFCFELRTVPERLENRPPKERCEMSKYRCTVCSYIYDPAVGDSTQGVAAGTAFENLPDTWVCPECGVGKDMFEKI